MLVATSHIAAPHVDWTQLAPIVALGLGMIVSLVLGLLGGNTGKVLAIVAGVIGAGTAGILAMTLWNSQDDVGGSFASHHGVARVIAGSLVMDKAALAGIVIACASAIAGLAIAARGRGTDDAGHGETAALILASATGMAILAAANDLVTVFLGLELLSIPLYVLCASHVDRAASLESGLKYLILGSVGSATALMGIALIYGATGEMNIDKISQVAGQGDLRGLVVPGVALLVAGFGFKLSLAPLHQWTPDVYDGAPTAVTAFMSVGTKAAALIVTARLLIVGFGQAGTGGVASLYDYWHPLLYVLAAASIIVGNVGALGQPSMKRLLGYSSIAQAGYLIAALSVGAVTGMLAYLIAYAVSTLTVFAVVAAREVERPDLGDDIAALDGIAHDRPLLAWLGTIGMFGLAGLPLTAGFFGKIIVSGYLIQGGETWLAVLLIVGSIISLAYYVSPVLRMWRAEPAPFPGGDGAPAPEPGAVLVSAAGVPETAPAHGEPYGARRSINEPRSVLAPRAPWELGAIAVIFAVLTLVLGVWPQPLFNLANDARQAIFTLH
ncbi:MAG: NADH-quinone oxidoreductase subunit N [Solirubrobacteraceae bacterium]|nr:NADH-quinone oxidoreductase subunit N [Patulibacter sp.]